MIESFARWCAAPLLAAGAVSCTAPQPPAEPAEPGVLVVRMREPVPAEAVDGLRSRFGRQGLVVAADADRRAVALRGPFPVMWEAERILTENAPPPAAAVASADRAAKEIRLVRLNSADAEQAAAVLRELFGRELDVTARPAARSLILEGPVSAVRQGVDVAAGLDGQGSADVWPASVERLRFEERTRRVLRTLRPKLSLTQVPVTRIFDILGELWGVDIVVNFEALAAVGVDTTKKIDLYNLSDVSLMTALRLVFEQLAWAGLVEMKPGFALDGNLILVSTNERLDSVLTGALYDVEELIASPRDGKPRRDAISELMRLLKEVDPSSWEGEDAKGRITEFQGVLLVRQTRTNQERIRSLLADLRRTLGKRAM